jgi:hypothetical protein
LRWRTSQQAGCPTIIGSIKRKQIRPLNQKRRNLSITENYCRTACKLAGYFTGNKNLAKKLFDIINDI